MAAPPRAMASSMPSSAARRASLPATAMSLRRGPRPSRWPCAGRSSARPCRGRRRSSDRAQSPAEAGECRVIGLPRPAVDAGHSAQEMVVGVEAGGRLALRALDLGPLQPGRHRAHHARRHPVLQVEHVGELALEAVGPEVRAGGGVDELPGDAHAGRRPCARCLRARSARRARGRSASRRRRGPCR